MTVELARSRLFPYLSYMPEPSTLSTFDQELAQHRGEIDAIDDTLIRLLKDRSAIVEKIGALKRREQPGRCPVRPGREAEQVRRVMQDFKGSLFMPAAAAVIWRMMIMSSLNLEGEMKVSVHAPKGDSDLFWLAREYFGPFSVTSRQPTPKRVLGDLMDNKVQMGVMPSMDLRDPALRWWHELPVTGGGRFRIFAALPFLRPGKTSADTPSGFAIGAIEPEETGNDLSYLQIEADEGVSQDRLQSAFTSAKLEARWIEIVTLGPGRRHHLVEVKGFLTPGHAGYREVEAALGPSLLATRYLGAVAAPEVV